VPRVLWIPGIARTSAAGAGLIRDRHGTAIFLDHSRLDLARLGSAEETMAVHYFHCTDGIDLVLDRTGRNVRCADDLLENACGAAERIMDALPPELDWSAWVVSVQDAGGRQVAVFSFPLRTQRLAA
jgi:hypothetical protein